MRIHIAADYLGYELARQLEDWLKASHEVIWHAADEYDEGDDYPIYCARVGQSVIQDEDNGLDTFGVVVGGSGTGEVIAINKVKGIRAALAVAPPQVAGGRRVENINAIVISIHLSDLEKAKGLVSAAIDTNYEGTVDSARRIINIGEYENRGTIEGWSVEG